MLTISAVLAKFTGTERHEDSAITIARASDKVSRDPAEQKRLEWEAIQRGLDELVAQLSDGHPGQ